MRVRLSPAAVIAVLFLVTSCKSGGDTTGPDDGKNPPPAAVATVSLDRTTATLQPGATTQLAVTTRDASGNVLTGRTVTWSSGAQSVATVNGTGLVTAVAPGTATITATSEGKTAQATITVNPIPVETVELTIPSATLQVGETSTLTAVAKSSNGTTLTGRTITWTSSEPSVATVNNGVVTAVAPGQTTITATSEGKNATGSITVVPVPVASVTLSSTAATIEVGATTTLTATPRAANGTALAGRTVTWSTGNATIATVANGVVTGVAPGTATITATSEGKSIDATITVTPIPVATVEVSPTNATLFVGDNNTFTVVTRAANGTALTGRAVTWSSDAPATATVTNGVVTAVSPGTTTIRVTSEGKTGTAQITVNALPPVATGLRVVGMGAWNGCALVDGKAWCWGRGELGNLGNGTRITQSATPVPVSGGLSFTSIGGGWNYMCGLATDAKAWCWGWGSLGALGNGDTDDKLEPTAVSGGLSFKQMHAAGLERLTCAIASNNRAYCWGSNAGGGVGAGLGGAGYAAPVAVSGNREFVHVSVGNTHACALQPSGAAWCWGSNAQGQLGNGNTTSSSVPVAVTGGHTFVEIASGFISTCAIKANGSAWCWGNNGNGMLGDGTNTNSNVPVQVTGGHQFTSIVSGGGTGVCALKANGSAWCWGDGSNGRNGNGGNAHQSAPVPVSGGHVFTQLAAGPYATCGVTASGIYCWGSNSYGNLGDGTTLPRNTPVKVLLP